MRHYSKYFFSFDFKTIQLIKYTPHNFFPFLLLLSPPFLSSCAQILGLPLRYSVSPWRYKDELYTDSVCKEFIILSKASIDIPKFQGTIECNEKYKMLCEFKEGKKYSMVPIL